LWTWHKGCVFLFLAILTLGNSRVYIGILYYDNIVLYVKALINKSFGGYTILGVPNVDPNNSHVQFWRNFDNSWFWCNMNVVKDICGFNACFHYIRINRHVSTLNKV